MKKTFDIYYTSDTHAKIFPVNYMTGERQNCGLMNIAAEIDKSGNTLVLDGGDSLQGTPLIVYYLEHAEEFPYHPVAEAFNAMGLDYFTLGNHDFNFGYDVIKNYLHAMHGQCLAANVKDLRGELGIKPYVIHTLENGLRIGIVGVVTDYVNVWENPEHLTELEVTDPIEAAENAYFAIAGECDLTVLIYHGGYEEDLETGEKLTESRENVACEMAKRTDFDLILTGHQHMPVEGISLYGTYSVQPPANAEKYLHLMARVDVPQAGAGNDKGEEALQGGFTEVSFTSKLRDVSEKTDRKLYALLEDLEQKTEKWLDQPIGHFKEEILPEDKLEIALHGSKVAALFNQVQMESVECDFSCTSLGNNPIGFKESVSIRDVYAAYAFANTSEVKEVTREILKEALERCAQYLDLDANGNPYISDVFMKPKIEHYNYDFYAGLDYAFDLRKPVGERVVRLAKLDGTELKDGETYRLVTSNYRATGTGGYEMIGQAPTVYSSADNVQDLLIDYIRKHPSLEIPENVKFEVLY